MPRATPAAVVVAAGGGRRWGGDGLWAGGPGVGGGCRRARDGVGRAHPGGRDRLRKRAGGVEAGAVEGVAHRRGRPEPGFGLPGEAAVDHVVEGL